jgi:hypothetical protein
MFTIALMTLLYINLTCPWIASENIEKRPLRHNISNYNSIKDRYTDKIQKQNNPIGKSQTCKINGL